MKRRALMSLTLGALPLVTTRWAAASERIGVLFLHGKNPGGPQSPQYAPVVAAMEKQGWLVALPDMPWSRNRYLQGHWDGAMAEIAQHVKSLQDKGATRIVLMGHSMGVPAAMSHAARGGTAHALVLLAPGHVPRGYFTSPQLAPVRESIEALAKIMKPKGCMCRLMPPVTAWSISPLMIAWQAWWKATNDDEQAVSMAMLGPRRS